MEVEIVDDPNCVPSSDPVEQMIQTGELARRTGVTQGRIRRWADKGDIPVCHRSGEHRIYPERSAIAAVERLIDEGLARGRARKK